MKQKTLILAVLLIFLISACAPKSVPTANPVDVQHTAEAAAFTMVAQTQESVPTNTPVPPTDTVAPTVPATLTPIISPTLENLLTATTALPTITGQTPVAAPATKIPATAIPLSSPASDSGNDNCNKTLTEWHGPTATLNVVNETKPQGKVVLSLYVVTEQGECGYLSDFSRGPVGQYSAGAFVEGKKSFKVFGSFHISEGNWKIIIKNDSIIAG